MSKRDEAALYEAPFLVCPSKPCEACSSHSKSTVENYARFWWRHVEAEAGNVRGLLEEFFLPFH